jgi:predicted permease
MSSVLAIALPVFAVIGAGVLAGRLRFADAGDSAALNRFVFRFAMPAALFGLMSGATGLTPADAALALAYGAPAMIVIFAAYFIGRRMFSLPKPEAGAHAFASTIGNAVFLGLPIALAIEGWARPFVVLMLVEGILVIGVGAALMSAREGEQHASRLNAARDSFVRPLKNPLVAAALAGFVFASVGIELPGPVRAFFDILGRAAGPAALFSLGLFLATHPLPPLKATASKIAAIALLKMAALPALAFGAHYLLRIDDPDYVAALALFTVTPTAVGAYVMSSQYGRYVAETVAAIAVTTALSVLTVNGVLVMFT